MLSAAALALASAHIYAGMPNLTAADAKPVMLWHSATLKVEGDRLKVTATTLYHNQADKEVAAKVFLPFHMENWAGDWGKDLSVRWADQPVEQAEMMATSSAVRHPDGTDGSQGRRVYQYNVSFGPKQKRSLKTSVSLPMTAVGLDGKERLIAYSVQGGAYPLSVAMQWPADEVFQVITRQPSTFPWQVGKKGAFVKVDGRRITPSRLSLRYYKGGF